MKIHRDQFNRRHALPRSDVRSSCFTDAPLNCRDLSMACHERSLVIEDASRRATDRPLTRLRRITTYHVRASDTSSSRQQQSALSRRISRRDTDNSRQFVLDAASSNDRGGSERIRKWNESLYEEAPEIQKILDDYQS